MNGKVNDKKVLFVIGATKGLCLTLTKKPLEGL